MIVRMVDISIIICAYNAEKTIRRCIDSLLFQDTDSKFEIVVINDGSEDSTREVLAEYDDEPKVVIINKENTGVSDSRNIAMKQVRGKYLTFVDADDYVAKNYLTTMFLGFSESNNIDMSICGYQKETESGKIIMEGAGKKGEIRGDKALEQVFISYGFEGYLVNKMFKKGLIDNLGLIFDTSLKISEDLYFCCQYLSNCNAVYFDPKPVYHYVMYDNSVLHSNSIGSYFTGKSLNSLQTFSKIKRVIPTENKRAMSAVKARECWLATSIARAIMAAPNRKEVDKSLFGKLKTISKENEKDFMDNVVLPPRDKIIYRMHWAFPRTLGTLWRVLGLKDHS